MLSYILKKRGEEAVCCHVNINLALSRSSHFIYQNPKHFIELVSKRLTEKKMQPTLAAYGR